MLKSQLLGAMATLALVAGQASAGTITSPGGDFTVGITPLGNIYDSPSDIGFERNADMYDPIQPGSPREAYGISAGAVSGVVDPFSFGTSNIVGVSSVFGVSAATIVTALQPGAIPLLNIAQVFTFAAENVVQIATTVTNVSGASQDVLFSREVDHDVLPPFSTTSTIDALVGPVFDASFYGFEDPDPLASYSSSSGAGGGVFGPSDYGLGMKIDLGTLAAGESTSFNIFHAINPLSSRGPTSDDALRAQLTGLGASFVLTSIGGDGTDLNIDAAALAYGPAVDNPVPEPTSMALFGLTALGMGGVVRRRRRQTAGDAT